MRVESLELILNQVRLDCQREVEQA